MPPGETTVRCPGCGHTSQIPFAAIRRDNLHCPACGKKIPLTSVAPPTESTTFTRPKPRRSSRPMRRR